jgi:hypothetical protein
VRVIRPVDSDPHSYNICLLGAVCCLKLVGHSSNRDAIGAEVEIVTAAGSQFATVSTASSYLSASDKRVHFGLGTDNTALRIEIRWPSGIRQTIKNVAADQILQIDEPPRPEPSQKP